MHLLPEGDWPALELCVWSVQRERWRRALVIKGSLDAEIWYEALGLGERVYVNGELRTLAVTFGLHLVAPRLVFALRGPGGWVPARIDVGASLLPWQLGLTRFQLMVAGRTLYQEARGTVHIPGERPRLTDDGSAPSQQEI
jgi:hypothetical protein